MRSIRYSVKYTKDVKLMSKRSNEIKKLRAVIDRMLAEEELEARHKDDPLQGEYAGARLSHQL